MDNFYSKIKNEFESAGDRHTMVNDAIVGMIKLRNNHAPYVYNKRKSTTEINLLEAVFSVSKYPIKEIKEIICKLANSNFKAVNVWFQNKRNIAEDKHVELEDIKLVSEYPNLLYNLSIKYYAEGGYKELLNDLQLEKKKKKQITQVLKHTSIHEVLNILINMGISHNDIINVLIIKGNYLLAHYNKKILKYTNDKLNNELITIDYLFAVLFQEMKTKNKTLYLELLK